MAEWLPKKVIINGLFAGLTPEGTLNSIPTYLGNNLIVADPYMSGGRAYYEDYYTHELEYAWQGAFGSNAQPMIQYAQQHGDTDGILLAEFNVKAGPNATYYRQTIAFYGKVTYLHQQDEHSDLDYIQCEVNTACRRVYADPQSPPLITHTWTFRPFSCPSAWVYHSGDQSAMRDWFYDKIRCAFGFLEYNDEEYFGAFLYAEVETFYDDNPLKGNQGQVLAIEVGELDTAFEINFDPDSIPGQDDPNEDPEDDGPGGGGPGGEGDKDKHQDAVPEPDLPPLSATAAGFVTVYKLYESNMQTFAKKLFNPTVWDAVKQLFADPLDFICGIMILPFSPSTTRLAKPILQRTPSIEWDYYYPVIEQQYHVVDCGTIEVPLFYKTAFDYNPYTKDEIYLPYCGYVSLDPDEVQGRTLKIKYHVDCMTGDCIAFVIRTALNGMAPVEQVIAQHSGNCGVRIPFGRQSFDAAVTASIQMISAAGGAAGGIAMLAGGAGGLAGGGKQLAEGMIASSVAGIGAGAVNGSKAHVERGGVLGSSAGYMGVQTPYLIRRVPYQSLPDKGYYRRLNGYPCNEAGKLSDFDGFTAVESIELSGIGATQEEKTEILNMLTGGVIV